MPDDQPQQIIRDIYHEIPRSTLIVGGALWAILFAMQGWHLITTLDLKDSQTEARGDIRVMASEQRSTSNDVQDLKEKFRDMDARLRAIEARQIEAREVRR